MVGFIFQHHGAYGVYYYVILTGIMVFIWGIIPFYGLKIQVSEILFHLPRCDICHPSRSENWQTAGNSRKTVKHCGRQFNTLVFLGFGRHIGCGSHLQIQWCMPLFLPCSLFERPILFEQTAAKSLLKNTHLGHFFWSV